MPIPAEFLRAARKYGPQVDDIAAGYRNPVTGRPLSGTALLLKLAKGESGFDMNAVSSAGARGGTQFIPGTRQEVLDKTNGKVDPWRSPDEALHATVLHLTGKLGNAPGLEGYNPGDPGYTDYILGQRIGDVGGQSGATEFKGKATRGLPAKTVQLPAAAQLDLQALLERITPPERPQPVGIPAPSFAAGQQFVSAPAVSSPTRPDEGAQLAALLQSANPGPGTFTIPGTKAQPARPSPSGGGQNGVARFDGKKVAAWMVPVLKYARRRGWKGTVTSGYRSDAEQTRIYNSGVRPAAVPRSLGGSGSNHSRTGFLQGAVDVTDAETLARILERKHSRLKYAGAKDPVHFSVPNPDGSY